MRICYITMEFPSPYETFAANDVRTLQRLGTELSVHSLRPAHPDLAALTDEHRVDGVPLTHNSIEATLAGCGVGLRQPAALLELLAWVLARTWRRPDHLVRSLILLPRALQIFDTIRRTRPDVIHLFWGHYPALVGHLVRRYLPGTTLSVFLGAYDLVWNYGGTPPVAGAAEVVWTHTRENLPAIVALGVREERIVVAYRGVDLGRFVPLRRPKVRGRIVAASRLIPAKACDEVVRVFARLLPQWPEATLVILGDGPERARLESLATALGAAHAITFRGHVAQEVVLEELAAAEVFLLMSRTESERLPNVVKEAMASRCLCVVTESPGIGELLRDGEHGFVVGRGDIEGAARRIRQIFNAEVAREEMVAAAYDQIRTNFDVDRNMERYIDRWKQLLGNDDRRAAGPSSGPGSVPANAMAPAGGDSGGAVTRIRSGS
jgi:glycosyltransferase involved in cell wall biosynthesis